MQHIEPFYNWRHLYTAEEDEKSPFFGRTYNEFAYTQTVYNYYIHPQWDDFGSKNLYLKILFTDYDLGFAIIELIGEWNDAIENDIMILRREVADNLEDHGISKFILVAENVLNFHSGDADYYEDWAECLNDTGGWVVLLNMPQQSQHDFLKRRLHHFVALYEYTNWRTHKPEFVFNQVDNFILKRLY
jgi:hypothetical protein